MRRCFRKSRGRKNKGGWKRGLRVHQSVLIQKLMDIAAANIRKTLSNQQGQRMFKLRYLTSLKSASPDKSVCSEIYLAQIRGGMFNWNQRMHACVLFCLRVSFYSI